jgi:hypothetical protein
MADGLRVILLAGTKKGVAGDVVTMSLRVAEREIAGGRAASAEERAATPTSAGTPGFAGQLCYDANFLYICTVGGLAGHATWTKTALSEA